MHVRRAFYQLSCIPSPFHGFKESFMHLCCMWMGGYVDLRGQFLEQSLPPFTMWVPGMNQVTKPDSKWHYLLIHLTRPFIVSLKV